MSEADTRAAPQALALTAALGLINRMLAAERWARDTLAAHVGKSVEVVMPPVAARVVVAAADRLEAGADDGRADLRIELKAADLPRVAASPESLMQVVKLDGDAAFAEALNQLARHLRPDVEEELSRIVGDVAAMRVVGAAQGAVHALGRAHQRLSENVAEYFLEENRQLVRPRQIEALAQEVRTLRDDLARLEKRIERLFPAA